MMQDSTKRQQTDRPPLRQHAETTRSHRRTEQHVVSMRRWQCVDWHTDPACINPPDRRQ